MATTDNTSDVIFIPDDGPDPLPSPPEPPPPTTISGPIGARWRELGGAAWGTPSFPAQSTGVGGTWVQFAHRDGSFSSIIWSSSTGARVVTQLMNQAYVRVSRMRGPLGLPTSEEMRTHDNVGRFQTFQRGLIVWHPSVGVFEVHGDIATKYLAEGGTRFGYPTTNETGTPDGRGRFNHFRNPANGGELSIYWTPETGAHEVFGLIRNGWASYGWERSALGYPTSGEMATHDGVGRWQTFERGIYVWHPDTGAHEVHGAILQRYSALGGSAWGYPITDEGDAKGPGRFNHFLELPGGHNKSIHWSPQTGAVEVYGYIRRKWEEMNWEHGYLGYPVSPETNWSEGGAGSRQQQFQGGRLLYRAGASQAAPDPMIWTKSINGTGMRGEVRVAVYSNDTAQFTGHVKTSGDAGYDYRIHVLLESQTNLAITFSEQGSVSGDLSLKGNERDNFSRPEPTELLPGSYLQFLQGAELKVEKNYSNHITGAIGDFFEGALKWIAGTALIATPGTALILLGGTTAVTTIAGGSLASGARIVSGTLWLAGPFGTAIALAAEAIARLASDERELSEEEYALAKLVFKESLPPKSDIKVTDAIGGNNRPFTYPRYDRKMVINFGDDWMDPRRYGMNDPDPDKRKVYGQTFIHELVHAWQYHNNAADISYVADAIWGLIRDDYDPGEVLDESWDWFGLEEQGAIVEHWFRDHYNGPGSALGTGTATDDFGLMSANARADQAFKYIEQNIRTGKN